jgi:hypothetical protein
MVRLVKTTLTVGFLIATSVGTSYGSGWEVNNIWWDVIPNFRGSGQTVCLAEQFNNERWRSLLMCTRPTAVLVVVGPQHNGICSLIVSIASLVGATVRNLSPNVF